MAGRLRRVLVLAARRLGPAPRYGRLGAWAVAVLAFSPPLVRGWDRVFKGALAAAALFALLEMGRRRRWLVPLAGGGRELLPVLLAYAFLSLLWAVAPAQTFSLFFRDLLRWALTVLLVARFAAAPGPRRLLLQALALGLAVTIAAGLLEGWQYREAPGYRVFGPWGHPNRLGAHLAASLPLLFVLPLPRPARVLLGAGAAVTLFLTGSRAAWLAAAAGLALTAALRRRWLLLAAAAGLAGGGLAASALLQVGLGARAGSLTSPAGWVAALEARPRLWDKALALSAQAPFTGHGYGRKTYRRLGGEREHVHSTYLAWLLELGLVGCGLYLGLYGRAARRLWRRRGEPLAAALLGAGGALALHGCVESLHHGHMLYFLGVLLGIALGATAERTA